ncbi:disease resistance protein L6-like [Syzygium oleosum]|uniref:disease resistance protein L6-like n=1 Tax=Syzygium oleosum TaxID=219896 RepID=UPI0024BAC177|nr:disease resistance protein L6-like [Syzygium oleosum]
MDMRKSSEAGMSGGELPAIDYDVFLSFRKLDTRQGFADCFYHVMREANIRVFFDEEEFHVGKEIANELPTAIEKSKIYVPIFSKGYASSPRCLRELTHMVECTKSKPFEKEIMPIFYDVEPRNVKLKSQPYVGTLENHEEKFGRQMMLKWEDALKSVAQIKGWELKKQGHWKFIHLMTRKILMKLKVDQLELGQLSDLNWNSPRIKFSSYCSARQLIGGGDDNTEGHDSKANDRKGDGVGREKDDNVALLDAHGREAGGQRVDGVPELGKGTWRPDEASMKVVEPWRKQEEMKVVTLREGLVGGIWARTFW